VLRATLWFLFYTDMTCTSTIFHCRTHVIFKCACSLPYYFLLHVFSNSDGSLFQNLLLKEATVTRKSAVTAPSPPTHTHHPQAETPLLTPDVLVCSVGTEILIEGQPDSEWEAHLDGGGWDREHAAAVAGRFPELVMQRASEQRPHKVSYKLCAAGPDQATGVVNNLRAQLAGAGLDTTVVFSGGDDVDILPSRASKGKALAFLLEQMEEACGGPPPAGVLVAGDSGNDVELFAVPGVRGCMVANAHPELREWCDAHERQGSNGDHAIFRASIDGPGGIREALYHFDLVRAPGSLDAQRGNADFGSMARRSAVVDLHVAFETALNAVGGAEERSRVIQAIEDALEDGFEIVAPSGAVSTREELLTWLRTRGWGSRSLHRLSPRAAAGLLAAELSEDGIGGGGEGGGEFRIWIDAYSERQLAPGVWLVRYRESQQRFPAPDGNSRSVRWSSAVLREIDGGGSGGDGVEEEKRYQWAYVHETWVQLP
jgi:sucrose-6-phosphatase